MIKELNITTYRSLKEINADVFHEIKFTGNILLVDKDYSEDKKYNEDDILNISKAWYKLYDEYFEKTDSFNFRKELKNKDQTLELLLKIKLIDSVLDILESLQENKDYVPNDVYLKMVVSLSNNLQKVDKYLKLDKTKPIQEQIDHIQAVKGGLQTRYELLFKDDVKADKNAELIYYTIKAHIEQALDRNLPEVINMLQWIAYEKLYLKKIKDVKQHSRKG